MNRTIPLLPELENLFGFVLQIFRAHGAADNKLNSTNCRSRSRGRFSDQIAAYQPVEISKKRRVRARGLHDFLGIHRLCRPGVLTGRVFQQSATLRNWIVPLHKQGIAPPAVRGVQDFLNF
jgi:hypothetical protein